ncbi:hypothetical protein ACHAW5_000365 [Stephanodiscus triporus]|uniref:Uncharacterized protein n=1 Tax=Stephanodiscus triporus TaxID=2934178 RepID=A0ABD3MX15_9STRA
MIAMTVLLAATCCRHMPIARALPRAGIIAGRRRGQRRTSEAVPLLDAFPCESDGGGEGGEGASSDEFLLDAIIENSSSSSGPDDLDGDESDNIRLGRRIVVVEKTDLDDRGDNPEEILTDEFGDRVDFAIRHRRHDVHGRAYCCILSSFAIIAVEWIRTYIYIPIREVFMKFKRLYECMNGGCDNHRRGKCGKRGRSVAFRPSSDGGMAGNDGSKFQNRFVSIASHKRPPPVVDKSSVDLPPWKMSPSIATASRPRAEARQILSRLERRQSSSILFASDGTKVKAPMELLNGSRMTRLNKEEER